ncbi:MAG: hypothetical protein Kow0074_14830 [Candidatus Zixiibacteriota bacterium]
MTRTHPWILWIVTCCLLISCGGGSEQTSDGSRGDVPSTAADRPPGALIINYAPDWCDTFPAPNVDSLLAIQWLEIYANTRGLNLATRRFSYGELVIQIGPRRSGDDGNWTYTINGEMATEAVSKQRLARSDTLTFTFQ